MLKKLYTLMPFKKEIFFLLKKLYLPNKKMFRHLHFVGIFEVRVATNKKFLIRHHGYQVENEIFWSGIFGGWDMVQTTSSIPCPVSTN